MQTLVHDRTIAPTSIESAGNVPMAVINLPAAPQVEYIKLHVKPKIAIASILVNYSAILRRKYKNT